MKRFAKNASEKKKPRDYALLLALGGGGDVLASAIFAESIKARGLIPIIASVVWERFVKDPLPGPRRLCDLSNATLIGEHLAQATKCTAFPNGALTNQAVLTEALGLENNYILDPHHGVTGLVEGLEVLGRLFPVTEAWGIDVGGDVLAEKSSRYLRSPLADAMLLSALVRVFPNANAAVFGIGVDGELPRQVWKRNIARHLRNRWIIETTSLPMKGIRKMSELLEARVVDTEATAMVIRAYQGLHGRFMVRDAGSIIYVDSATLCGFIYKASDVCERINALPDMVRQTDSIQKASDIIENYGYQSEWRYENEKVAKLKGPYSNLGQNELRPLVFELLREISSQKPVINFVAERYLAERLKVNIGCIRELLEELREERFITLYPPFIKLNKN